MLRTRKSRWIAAAAVLLALTLAGVVAGLVLRHHKPRVTACSPRERTALAFYREHQLTRDQAGAIVGNLYMESGLKPEAVAAEGTGYGLAQWQGGRFDDLKQFAAAQSPAQPWQDFDTQLKFVWHELTEDPDFAKAYAELKQAPDVATATRVFALGYLRAGMPLLQRRTAFAEGVLNPERGCG